MPSERVGHDIARSSASANSGRLTIIEAEVTAPASAASIIPMLTPREIPKSSALMMRCFGSGVNPTRTIEPDANEIHQHLGAMPGKGDRARLVAVVKVHRYLLDLQAVEARDEKRFQVEAESAQRLTREDYLGRMGGESLESGLGVEDAGEKNLLREPIEDTTHQVSCVEIMEKCRAHDVTRLGQHAARDCHIGALFQRVQQLRDLGARVRQVGVDEDPIVAVGVKHPASDGVAFPTICIVPQHDRQFVVAGEVSGNARRRELTAIVDDYNLGWEFQTRSELPQMGEDSRKMAATVPRRDDDRHERPRRSGDRKSVLVREGGFSKCHKVCVFNRLSA